MLLTDPPARVPTSAPQRPPRISACPVLMVPPRALRQPQQPSGKHNGNREAVNHQTGQPDFLFPTPGWTLSQKRSLGHARLVPMPLVVIHRGKAPALRIAGTPLTPREALLLATVGEGRVVPSPAGTQV